MEGDPEESLDRFNEAVDEQWKAAYIVGYGDVNKKDGTLTLASVAKPQDFETIVFENGWAFGRRNTEWIHDDQLAECVMRQQEKAKEYARKADEKEKEALQEWKGIRLYELNGKEIEGRYVYEKTGYVESAAQTVAHAAGYNRAIKEILQTGQRD